VGRKHHKVTSLCRRNTSKLILRNTYINLPSLVAVKVLESASSQKVSTNSYLSIADTLAAVNDKQLLARQPGIAALVGGGVVVIDLAKLASFTPGGIDHIRYIFSPPPLPQAWKSN